MLDRDSPAVPLLGVDETLARITGLPAPLPGDPRRQAVPSIHGTVYQAWWSIDAWLRLADADEIIYLEGAEDFDVIGADGAKTVQVKRSTRSISLGNAKAHEALENFWRLASKEVSRRVDFHYLTTSSIATEQDGDFGGLNGIEAWRAAQTNLELAAKVARYLEAKLDTKSSLRAFLASATAKLVQERLIRRVHWLTEQPDVEVVKRSVDDRIAVLLHGQRRAVSLSPIVRKYLESRFWEVVLEPEPARRCLTRGELLRQVEAATTTYLPVTIDQLPDLIGNAPPGLGLLNLLLEKSPRPPEPLLRRPALTKRLEALVKHRKVVLITGTVHKGKTTVAQLVASTLCPEAWWVNLTDRRLDQVDNVLLALAGRIGSEDCPGLIVIDDLDISPTAHRVYRDSLALVLHRASATGRGVLLTAQGASSDSAFVQDFNNIELLDVPELSFEETQALCVEHGCPQGLATIWGPLVNAWTKGHPKLVQVRLAELAARGWPQPSATDYTTQSSAVISARQMARQLLSDSVPGPLAEFVYTASECSVLMHRSVAIRLAEAVEGLANAGDIIDDLTGKWFERINGEWFRTTALIHGVAVEVWSPEKRKRAHVLLHDAILTKQPLDPGEAAALLVHAYIGGEPRRLALTGMHLQLIEGNDVRPEVERQLLWLPYVALEAGQSITDDAMAGAILRGLQFRVASTLDADCLPQVCERWADDIERIPQPDAKSVTRAMMWLSVGSAMSLKVPLKARLTAIVGIEGLPSELLKLQADGARQFFENSDAANDLPANGTTAQAILFCAIRSVRDVVTLDELLQWLDNVATEDLRQQFDAMLGWPLVQTLGAFVQGAWADEHEETKDWEPWLVLFERMDEYAKRRASPRFGREAAKARATILTEYLGRSQDAVTVLDQAEIAFGPSVVLLEQRANVRFQVEDDEAVLGIWKQLTSDPASNIALDPFACRRAGISATRLKRWDEAEQIFRAAADSIQPGSLEVTKFGLRVDAALAVSRGGSQPAAARLLAEAVLELPAEAATEGDARWEAVQRAAVEVCRIIKDRLWKPTEAEPQFEPGNASSPAMKVSKVEPGQAARSEMTRVQVLHLAATVGMEPPAPAEELAALASSRYILVRWFASEARLALAYAGCAGTGFIKALLDFETAMADLSAKWQSRLPLEPDEGPEANLTVVPERWFGLLAAGIICTGPELITHLGKWLDESSQELGVDAALTSAVRLVLDGAARPAETLYEATNPLSMRCGAAARLLLDEQTASKALQLQGFLASALVSDGSFTRQELFNRHVARRFSSSWRAHARNRFQFQSPRVSVPMLLSALDDVDHGGGTLRSVLAAAASATGQPLGDFLDRLS